MSLDSLFDDFALFDDWEDRYRYIIEIGQNLEPLSDDEHSEEFKVPGCVSQVWLVSEKSGDRMLFRGDSDAHIVSGLVAILLTIYNDKTPEEILAIDIKAIFNRLGLNEHLSPQRSNGFSSMVQRIRKDAETAISV